MTQDQRLGIAYDIQEGLTWTLRNGRKVTIDRRMAAFLRACDNDARLVDVLRRRLAALARR